MNKKEYSLALKFTAKTAEVARKVRDLGRDIDNRLSLSNSKALKGIGKIASGFGGIASGIIRVSGMIGGVFVGGLQMAFGLVGKIARGLMHLPITGLKLLLGAGAGIYAAHKSLSPSGEMERYKIQLDVLKKGNLYNYLTGASAGKPFQMGESVQAGVLMEAFNVSSRKYLSTVMDAAAGFKKPLEEVVRMLAYAKSGRSGEAIESAGMIGITRRDLEKFGIRFEKTGAVTAETADKLMTAMAQVMQSRFGGMAKRIGTGSYEGAVSDLGDSVFRAFAAAGEKFLPFATKIVRSVSGIVTTIGGQLSKLPWDSWGAKLAAGMEAAGRIIDNLFDPKRRAEIGGSIVDGWNNIRDDIPKLFKAVWLDTGDFIINTILPKTEALFIFAFTRGGQIIKDAAISALSQIMESRQEREERQVKDFVITQKMLVHKQLYDKTPKGRRQAAMDLTYLSQYGINKYNEMANRRHPEILSSPITDIPFARTMSLINAMTDQSNIKKTWRMLTAEKQYDPIALSLYRTGSGSLGAGYINGHAQPLSQEQMNFNASLQMLAGLMPNMFRVRKETDIFGREIQRFTGELKSNNDENSKTLQQILTELRTLNNNVGGR